MNRHEITLVLARPANGVIGADGRMPWHPPADLRRFKQLTTGRPLIMGRKTFDSPPALLEGRRHLVLTRAPQWPAQHADAPHSAPEALPLPNAPPLIVPGGPETYPPL